MNYKIKLNRDELNTLAWVGDRYESAGILYDSLKLVPEDDKFYFANRQDRTTEFLWEIEEHLIWEYSDAIPSDWSYSNPDDCPMTIPPCIGGTLGDKLATLYEEII